MFENAARRARSQARQPVLPSSRSPATPLFAAPPEALDARRVKPGQVLQMSLWAVFAVAVLPERAWPLVLVPALFGLTLFISRAWALRGTEWAKSRERTATEMRPGEAFSFGVLLASLLAGLWMGGHGALFVLPVVAGLLIVGGRTLVGTWTAMHERDETARRPAERGLPAIAAPLLDAMSAGERAEFVQSLCRHSVRHTLEEASRALRLALSTRPRPEEELHEQLAERFGEAVARVVIEDAVHEGKVRRYGKHLATAMDSAYRAA